MGLGKRKCGEKSVLEGIFCKMLETDWSVGLCNSGVSDIPEDRICVSSWMKWVRFELKPGKARKHTSAQFF